MRYIFIFKAETSDNLPKQNNTFFWPVKIISAQHWSNNGKN